MSNIDKQALREVAERATPGNWRRTSSLFNGITVTPFSLCGEEVTLAHTVEKRDAEFIAAANPATMLALLDENIQLQREKDATEAVALALRDDMRDAREKLEAAERRIAEHCKVLNSLAAVARRYLPDYDEHPEIQAADELLESAAGIGVKQQEDIVDSDVGSRNQPGMVVAVHVGVGDFVKIKGQVFEVEETDFDDHDVTLWFVGGNALKCSAGCPVEVVSAPVAAGIKVKES
ncbi:TPA: ead/Ea22-like family protein [Salmonella enterica]|uniref:Ead/Ea22-like family protein n=1 Tax=Salmonella enterica TaxID=28901 RepID=A0A743C9X5_SALER|nr:ead/Ea22-like family protein [Salmonella enterica]